CRRIDGCWRTQCALGSTLTLPSRGTGNTTRTLHRARYAMNSNRKRWVAPVEEERLRGFRQTPPAHSAAGFGRCRFGMDGHRSSAMDSIPGLIHALGKNMGALTLCTVAFPANPQSCLKARGDFSSRRIKSPCMPSVVEL